MDIGSGVTEWLCSPYFVLAAGPVLLAVGALLSAARVSRRLAELEDFLHNHPLHSGQP